MARASFFSFYSGPSTVTVTIEFPGDWSSNIWLVRSGPSGKLAFLLLLRALSKESGFASTGSLKYQALRGRRKLCGFGRRKSAVSDGVAEVRSSNVAGWRMDGRSECCKSGGKENVWKSPLSRGWSSEGDPDRALPGSRIQRCRGRHRSRALPRTLGRGLLLLWPMIESLLEGGMAWSRSMISGS